MIGSLAMDYVSTVVKTLSPMNLPLKKADCCMEISISMKVESLILNIFEIIFTMP